MKKLLKNKYATAALAVLAIVATYILFQSPSTGLAFFATFPLVMKIGTKDFTVKTQEEKDQMDQLLTIMNEITGKAIAGFMTAEQATKKIEEKIAEKGFKLEDDVKFKEYSDAVIAQGIELKAMKEAGNSLAGKSIAEQISAQVKENKQGWDDFVSKKSQKFTLQLKVAGTMRPSVNAGAGTIPYQFLPGVDDIMVGRVKPFLIDLIGVQQTNSPTIYWTNKTNADGTVAFIADTGSLTEIDFDLTAESSNAKNVGDYIKVHENMLNDIPYITSVIQNELIYQVNHICDSEVYSGSGATVHLKGITVYAASGFSLTSLAYINPNLFDVILACKTQILASSDMFNPNLVLLNPVDYAAMLGAKTSEGVYVIPPFASANGDVAGMVIYQSNLVTAGDIVVMDSSKCNLFELGNMTIEMGLDSTDFTDMTRTFRGYRRLHFFISDNNTTAFVYDTIADIKAAVGI